MSLLGPLVVRVERGRRRVPGRGERALLTLLSLESSRRIASDRIVEALWEDRLPADPHNALQTRVSKLRRTVGGIVVTEPGGYRLDVPRDDVDVHRFRALVARGRARTALSLWRGEPLVEFADTRWAQLEAVALHEERLHALADRIDADLDDGRHRDLVPELQRLTADHATHERFWSQLMVALYRSDRQAEALAAFRRARERLAADFGLDPGRRLVATEQAVLRQDPRLSPPVPVGRSSPPPPSGASPPAPLGRLVGRTTELRRCSAALREHRLVSIVGPGGVGKTRLAVESARLEARRRADGAAVVDLGTVDDDAGVLRAVATAVGVERLPDTDDLDAVESWVRRRDFLLVLDSCDHVATAVTTLLQRLLGTAPGLAVLAIGRTALDVPARVEVQVGPLDHGEASALFVQRVSDVEGIDARALDEDAVDLVVDLVDRLPLAIELAAAWTRVLPLAAIVERLEGDLGLLDQSTGSGVVARPGLREVVASGLRLLDDDAQTLFRRLAPFRGSWTLEDAEAVCTGPGGDGPAVVPALGRLVSSSLVVAEHGRFRLLRALAEVADERLRSADEHDVLRRAHAVHFLTVAREAATGLRGPTQGRWLRSLRASATDLAAAFEWARRDQAIHVDELLLAAAGSGWFWFLGRHGDGRRELHAALQAAEERGTASPAPLGQALQARSIVLRPGGCLVHPDSEADELAAASHEMLTGVGDRRRALLSKVMALVPAVGGADVAGSLAALTDAAETLRRHDDPWAAAVADFVAMEIHVQQGTIDDAVAVGERARAGFEDVGDAWGTSSVAGHLGHGLRLTGRTVDAAALLEVGRDEAARVGVRNTLAGIHVDLARIALDRGDRVATGRSVDRARSLATDLGNRMLVGMADVVEAAALIDRDRPDLAGQLLRSAIESFTVEGVPGGHAEALALATVVAVERGDLGAAGRHAERARRVARAIRDAGLHARALEALALVEAARGSHEAAAANIGRAQTLRRDGHRPASRTELAVSDRVAAFADGDRRTTPPSTGTG